MKDIVLCIEDNADNLVLFQRAIEGIGYRFEGVHTGVEGLNVAEELKPGLILLDIQLPDINGYEVARRMRSSGNWHLQYVPIIAITSNALKGDAEKALEAGCDVYMAKPINIRELWVRVEGLLEATRSR